MYSYCTRTLYIGLTRSSSVPDCGIASCRIEQQILTKSNRAIVTEPATDIVAEDADHIVERDREIERLRRNKPPLMDNVVLAEDEKKAWAPRWLICLIVTLVALIAAGGVTVVVLVFMLEKQRDDSSRDVINQRCFESREELHAAVDEAFEIVSSGSNVTDSLSRYGWPINSWCIQCHQLFFCLFGLSQRSLEGI